VAVDDRDWVVKFGVVSSTLRNQRFRAPFFDVVGEKIPFTALNAVARHLKARLKRRPNGIYVAHDSMGWPRYVGRGSIFGRLKSRHKKGRRELYYFSFYVLKDKEREKEIETMLIRAAGPLLHYNVQKKRIDTRAGSLRDYGVGTRFYERRPKRGRSK
jgi:hypothetical protein